MGHDCFYFVLPYAPGLIASKIATIPTLDIMRMNLDDVPQRRCLLDAAAESNMHISQFEVWQNPHCSIGRHFSHTSFLDVSRAL